MLEPTVAEAVFGAGLPSASLADVLKAVLPNNATALAEISGIDVSVIETARTTLRQAFADSFRVVYIIAAPLDLGTTMTALFLRSLKSTMNYEVDAPIEKLQAKQHSPDTTIQA